jgi:hypothetical protein
MSVERLFNPHVGSASVTTGRTTLDLLGLSLPYTQVDLLTPADFADESNKSGFRAGWGQLVNDRVLELLHKVGVMVPFYCVHLAEPVGELGPST